MPPWYALHVASCAESVVAQKLAGEGVESYYPFSVRKSQRLYRADVERVFFPGYVFAQFDLVDRHTVTNLPQVIRILGWGNIPAAVPEEEIDALRTMTTSPLLISGCAFIPAGETVRICSGPLQGIQGIVVFSRPGKARVIVSVAMLQQSISAEVDADSLEVMAA